MLNKTWDVRDQTEEALKTEAEKLYKQIESGYKMVKKVSKLEDAERIIDKIWVMKKWASDIELELIRREYTNETQTADAGTN